MKDYVAEYQASLRAKAQASEPTVERDTKPFIIAEIGVNHGGSFEMAKKLVKAAAASGADAVKFQTFFRDFMDSRLDSSYTHLLHEHFLSGQEMHQLFMLAERLGLEWFSTPFGSDAIEFLETHKMKIWKIPSGFNRNMEYMERVAALNPERVIISTGMCYWNDIKRACDIFRKVPLVDVLLCTTAYPAPPESINLNKFNTGIYNGISDHSEGIEISIAAAGLGAYVFEKHFTLFKELPGPDHKASTEPGEFKRMVDSIHNVHKALNGTFGFHEEEAKTKDLVDRRMKDALL